MLDVAMDAHARNQLATRFGAIASEAGRFIMSIYSGTPSITTKADGSPVSEADVGAERLIRERLSQLLPDTPLIAEESFKPQQGASLPDRFLLVDPLDGTREFISHNGEFTVNIALIETGRPIVGCVYAPAREVIYLAGAAAFRAELAPGAVLPPPGHLQVITTSAYPEAGLRAVASRSHLDQATEALLARLPVAARQSAGSSLKFCVIAQGDADIYPRLAPTMEWDTAAGQAVLVAAGGCVMGRDGTPLSYGKTASDLRNDGFIAWGQAPLLKYAP